MKKLITLLLVFMLTSTVNMFASFVEDYLGNPIEYTFDPPEGVYSADELQSITLKFPNATTIGGSKQGNTEILVKRKYPNGKTDDSAYWITPKGNKLEITGLIPASGAFESGTFEYGTWEIFIWGFNIYVDGQYLDNDVVVKYTIAPPDFSLESAVPANSETVNSLENILIDFDADSVLTGSAEVVVNGAKDVIATLTPTANAGQVQVVLSQAITAEGNYSLTIPAKTFKLADGSGNQEVTLNYSVKFPAWNATEILANPENGAKKTNLNAITLTFPEDIEIVGTEALTLGNIPVTAAKTGAREVSITPTAPVADWAVGEYKLTIPADYFKGTSKRSPKLSYSWEIVSSLLTIESFEIYKEYTKEVTLDLTNGVAYSGFQADITLPEGLTVVGDFTLNRGVEGNHVLQSNVLRSTGKTRLLCYPSKKVNGSMPDLTGNSGEALVTFTVEASTDFVGGDITVDGIVFSTADGESSKLQDASAKVEAREYATEITFTNAPEAAFETGEVTPEGQEFTAAVNAGAYNKGIEWSVVQSEEQPVITFIDGIITAVGVGEAVITATALGAAPDKPVTKSCTVTVVYTHAEAIAITTQDGSETVAIEALDEYQLTATATPTTNKDIVWESSKPGVVTVDQTGKLTGVTVGDAVITAKIVDAEDNVYVSDTINVTVASTPATEVVIMTTDETPAVAPDSADLHVTGTATYKAKVNDLATNKAVAWESDKPKIAEVAYNAETGIATVTAKAVGTAVITVKALGADTEGEPVVDTITINVLVTNAAEIQITGEVAAQYESADDGDAATFKLTAVVAPDYTTYKKVAWVSSKHEAATVDQEGNVTIGSTPGNVTITAIAINNEEYDAEKDYTDYVKATVKFAVVHTFATSVAIEQLQESIPTLKAADNSKNTFQLTAVAAPTTNKDIVWEVRYDENNTEENPVVSVDQTGLVTALRTGQATVVARIEETEIIDSRVIKVGATPGDVNDNGTLDVFDINLLAAYILEADNLPENFVAAAADYNNDGFVNVADIITLSNDVLTEEDTPAGANARMYRTRQYADSSNSLFIEDFTIVEGETKQIAIMLNNNVAFSAFQADIYLPEGLEIVEATLSDRKADHTLASAMRNNGSVRLLSYSLGVNAFAGSEGELVYLTVKATDNFVGDFQIEIDNIKFATVDFAEYYLEPTVANVAGYTGVESVEGDEIVVKVVGNSIVAPEGAEVYDLNGLRVNAENLAKGIYIVKVGNQVVKVII